MRTGFQVKMSAASNFNMTQNVVIVSEGYFHANCNFNNKKISTLQTTFSNIHSYSHFHIQLMLHHSTSSMVNKQLQVTFSASFIITQNYFI